MRLRRLVTGLALGGLLVLSGASAASAAAPVDLGSDQLIDDANVLTDAQESQVRDALQSYDDATGNDLRVVFVGTFSDPSDRQGWATAVAESGTFSKPAVVLAVATDARQYGFATSSDFPISDSDVSDIASGEMRTDFGRGDWAGGVEALASDLQSGSGSSSGSGGSSGSSSGFGLFITVVLLAALVIVVIVLVRIFRRRRRAAVATGAQAPAGPPPVDQKELDQRASRALIALDDDLTSSEQELGFATAEFGEDATKVFVAALAKAKATSRDAFTIRQQLDDEIPETPEKKRELTERIIALCEQAEHTLQEQKTAFDDLRKLEQQLPQLVPATRAEHDRLTKRGTDAAGALQAIRSQYGDAAVRGAADDLQQANDLLELADKALDDTGTAQAMNAAGEATVALRSAQQANAQASQLLDGIVSAPGEFMAAKQRLDAAVTDAQQDIVEGQRVASPTPELTAALAATRQAVEDVQLQAPHAGLATMEEADGRLERALAPVRDQQERIAKAAQALPRAIGAAQDAVSSARRYIDNRRGGIGSTARTRLSEAQRLLEQAVDDQQRDPVGALDSARRAQSTAVAAQAAAEDDVDDFRNNGGGWGGGYGGGGSGGSFSGAVLGGILGGVLSGGGHRGGGWGGGSSWGGGGFGGGGGWSGGGGGWGGGGGSFGGGGGGGSF